jgi:hypothetical protein
MQVDSRVSSMALATPIAGMRIYIRKTIGCFIRQIREVISDISESALFSPVLSRQ